MGDTRYNPATIAQLNVGQIVHGISGYSRTTKCVHGNLYYAYMGQDMMEAGIDEDTDVVLVDDDDTHEIECCK